MPGSQSPYLTCRLQKGTSLAAAANGKYGLSLPFNLLTDYKPELLLAGQCLGLVGWLHWVFFAVWTFSTRGEQGLFSVEVHDLLIAETSRCRAQALGLRHSSCGVQA